MDKLSIDSLAGDFVPSTIEATHLGRPNSFCVLSAMAVAFTD